jgi:hypothetical protein
VSAGEPVRQWTAHQFTRNVSAGKYATIFDRKCIFRQSVISVAGGLGEWGS